MNNKYIPLFEPFTFPSGFRIDNKVVMSPMTTQSSFDNGMVTTDELLYYKRRTTGAGMVITSCAQVKENGKFPGSISASSDKHIRSLSKVAEAIKSTGTKAILQIFHVGRMESSRTIGGEQPVSASAVPANREFAETPRALESNEVQEMVDAFGEATRRAIQAGFDGIEIHGANTYLIQQFFSPHSNRRDDKWGGSLEKRMTFPLEVVRSAKAAIDKYAVKPFLFGYRLSPEEIEEPGITLEDTVALLKALKKEGLDYFHNSMGHYRRPSIRNKESEKQTITSIREEIGNDFPLIGVGSVTTPNDVLDVFNAGYTLAAMGRALIVEPDWIRKVKDGKEEQIRGTITKESIDDLVLPDKMVEFMLAGQDAVPFSEELRRELGN